MNKRHHNLRLYFCLIATVLICIGCAPALQEPVEVVLKMQTAAQALSFLNERSQRATPLIAKGKCVLQYYDTEKKKTKKESLPMVRIVVNPPSELYLQGDATLVPKAIMLGSNEREFWLLMKPKEISTYWWGRWDGLDSSEGLLINPRNVFEALGIMEIEAVENWSLSKQNGFDVLAKQERGVITKKMYVYSRSYLIKKIEYFDSQGQALAYTELDGYTEASEGFYMPTSINIIAYGENGVEDALSITLDLKSIGPKEITEGMRNYYFNRPEPRGFKHIWVNKDGKWTEQQQ